MRQQELAHFFDSSSLENEIQRKTAFKKDRNFLIKNIPLFLKPNLRIAY